MKNRIKLLIISLIIIIIIGFIIRSNLIIKIKVTNNNNEKKGDFYFSILDFFFRMVGYAIILILFNLLAKNKKNFKSFEYTLKKVKLKDIYIFIIISIYLTILGFSMGILKSKIIYLLKKEFIDMSFESADKINFYGINLIDIYKKNGILRLAFEFLINLFLCACAEEYIFRYNYFKIIENDNYFEYIFFNSLIFSLYHIGGGFLNIFSAFLSSFLVYTPLYLKYNNITINIIFHYFTNILIFCLSTLLNILFGNINIIKQLLNINIFLIISFLLILIIPLIVILTNRIKIYKNNLIIYP